MKHRCVIVVRVVLLFVLAGITGGSAAKGEPPQAHVDIKAVHGAAFVSANGKDYRPLHAGDLLKAGSILKTAPNSTVDLVLPDSGSIMRMRPDSTLQFSRLDKMPVGELTVSDTSLKLLKGSVVGVQRNLCAPSRFDIMTHHETATVIGTEYVVNADGAVSVLNGTVRLNYNLPGNHGSTKVSVPAGYTFDPASGTVVPTSSSYLQNLIADIKTVKRNAKVFKVDGATIVVQPGKFVSPVHGQHGHDHDHDGDHGYGKNNHWFGYESPGSGHPGDKGGFD